MKKLTYQTFLVTLLSLLCFQSTQAQTHVSGSVYTNTTWTKANSPYIVDATIVFFPGANLTIEPGVVVKFEDSAALEIREGDFKAAGTITDTIIFTSNSLTPTDTSYLGIKFTSMKSVEMSYCIVEYAFEGINLGISTKLMKPLKNCIFRNNMNALGERFDVSRFIIDQCLFIKNGYCGMNGSGETNVMNSAFINNFRGLISGSLLINSVFCGNHFGIEYFDTVRNCQFINNDTGYLGQFRLMTNCNFTQNHTGIYSSINAEDTLRDNNIFNNIIGITLDYNYSKTTVFNNRICKNTLYNIKYTQKPNNTLINNCWCETDSALIATKIYDGYDNNKLGLVSFVPFNSCDTTEISGFP
ncbi:MAG: hypothetical protein HYZ42_10185, partial [Bacteroidetes bacterium]|nr:hypothetical protein [Bacteroidota bacterium]